MAKTVEIDCELWRPALAAFYRAEAWLQSAENVARGFPLTVEDKRTIRSLATAFELQPVASKRAA
jgi:hypothetical protein